MLKSELVRSICPDTRCLWKTSLCRSLSWQTRRGAERRTQPYSSCMKIFNETFSGHRHHCDHKNLRHTGQAYVRASPLKQFGLVTHGLSILPTLLWWCNFILSHATWGSDIIVWNGFHGVARCATTSCITIGAYYYYFFGGLICLSS